MSPRTKAHNATSPDYDKLMTYRLNILPEHKLALSDIQKVIIGPMQDVSALLN